MSRKDFDGSLVSVTIPTPPPAAAASAPRDIGWQALAPTIACTVIATIVVALRWYTRCRLVGCVGADDYVILLSLSLCWAMLAVIALARSEGIGVYNTGLIHASHLAKMLVVSNILWASTVAFTKASILMQYLRIFSYRLSRLACYVLIFLLLPAACWAIFAGTFLCSPVQKLWHPELSGHCLDAQTYWLSVAALDICLDFLVLLLPLPAMTSLRLPPRQKIALLLVFTLGFVICIIGIIRLALVISTAAAGDFVQSGIWAIIWSAAEANVGIVCASLLALKPLLTHFWPSLLDESGDHVPPHCLRVPMVQESDEVPIWQASGSSAHPILHSRDDSGTPTTAFSPPKTFSIGDSGHVRWSGGLPSPKIGDMPLSVTA